MSRMKKIILILTSMLFVGCTRKVYVDRETNEIIKQIKLKGIDFINLQKVDNDYEYPNVYVDTYTDVLYAIYDRRMTAIMKADGTYLTYKEFLDRQNDDKIISLLKLKNEIEELKCQN